MIRAALTFLGGLAAGILFLLWILAGDDDDPYRVVDAIPVPATEYGIRTVPLSVSETGQAIAAERAIARA